MTAEVQNQLKKVHKSIERGLITVFQAQDIISNMDCEAITTEEKNTEIERLYSIENPAS